MSSLEQSKQTLSQKLAGTVANSFLFARARQLWAANQKDWNFPLSKIQKLLTGGYLILSDYSAGLFPPKFDDRAKAYQGEIDYNFSLPGVSSDEPLNCTKPFWSAGIARLYIELYLDMIDVFERYGINPGQRVLELGCGCGWMSEFLALGGYRVVGTTIAPSDVELGLKKKAAVELKNISGSLDFEASPMESVDKIRLLGDGFDAAFIFEALHHAFDWREALTSAEKCLRPGGWLLIANEPQLLHTFISYRVAKLSNTHEIGMSKRAVVEHLKKIGFSRVEALGPPFYDFKNGIRILAQKAR